MQLITRLPIVRYLKRSASNQLKKFPRRRQGEIVPPQEMAAKIDGRALHYVFKIGNRNESIRFYREILGMTVLRHEEFAEGCEAACNGPYDTRWSKTMIGYGPEDDHFVFELTYNYPIHDYARGNEFVGVYIKSRESLERAKTNNWPVLEGNVLEAPGGYKFYIIDEPQPEGDPVVKVALASSDLQKSLNYWQGVLGLNLFQQNDTSIIVGFKEREAKLELVKIDEAIDRGQAYGRIAFSCPHDQQPIIDEKIKEENAKVLIPLTSLDTPGKATVRVIILADPDDHEICFVDDGPFKELSKYVPEDEKVLEVQMKKEAEFLAEQSAKKE